MIDWLHFTVYGMPHRPIAAGSLLAVTEHGELEWHSARRAQFNGEAGATIRAVSRDVADDGFADTLELDGSPAKFMQGHNVFGPDDARGLAYELAARVLHASLAREAVSARCQFDPCEFSTALHMLALCLDSRPRLLREPSGRKSRDPSSRCAVLHRVDVTYSTDLGDGETVRAWLQHAETAAAMRFRGRGMLKGTTLYLGSRSRRWSARIYAKGDELEAKPPKGERGVPDELQPAAVREFPALRAHADGLLRAELVLRGLELERIGLRYLADWQPAHARETWAAKFGGFTMSDQHAPADLSALPKHLRKVVAAWQSGADLRACFSRASFYRHRRELLPYGLDVAARCPTAPERALELEAAPVRRWPRDLVSMFDLEHQVPTWARAAGLYFEPRADWRIADRPAPALPSGRGVRYLPPPPPRRELERRAELEATAA